MDPEVQESLNILRPPVQRLYKNHWYSKQEVGRHTIEVNRNLYAPTRRFNNTWDVRDTTSSVSLIVKKSDENVVVENYSVLSYTNLQFSKVTDNVSPSNDGPEVVRPVIKVTVIPNNTSVKRKKIFCSKRIQTTVSNQESSIKSENVYLVVKHRKGKKIYEIKGTGSAEFTKSYSHHSKNEEISVKQNIKQLLKSLNMDTKKKKGRIKRPMGGDDEEVEDEQFQRYSGEKCTCSRQIGTYDIFASTMAPAQMEQNIKQHLNSLHEKKMRNLGKPRHPNDEVPSEEEPFEKITYDCKCQPRNARTAYQNPKKGQVKITGKLGLNHDDQYVLQCDASIDDQPFQTMYQTHRMSTVPRDNPFRRSCDCPQDSINGRSTFNNESKVQPRNHKDSTVQVDMYSDTMKPILCPAMQSNTYRSQETQCKPANFNQVCFSNIDKLKIYANKDEAFQCSCDNTDNLIINPTLREGDKGASTFTNPLVIISVYPKPEGTQSRESSPTRTPRNVKNAADKQPVRRVISPLKSKIEKKPIKRNDRSTTKPEVTTQPKTIRSPVKTQKVTAKAERTERSENIINKTETIRPRSRSSSPPSSPTRQKPELKFTAENKTIKMKKEVNRTRSPDRNANSQFVKTTQQKLTTVQQTETKTSRQKEMKMSHQRDTKFSSEGSKSRYPANKKHILNTSDESSQDFIDKDTPKSSKGVNTDVTLSKKAILDSFTHTCECVIDGQSSWDGHASQKHQSEWADTITDASNVAVSIDGENEFYDVLFCNGERVTDVNVRHIETDQSLPNLLYATDEGTPRKRSDSYAYKHDQSYDAEVPRLSGLVVRDSIELFHSEFSKLRRDNISRRAEKSDSKLVVTESLSVSDHGVFSKGNKKCSATPSKHYAGDSCPVTNPIERDREIRELLGIERPKAPTVSPVSSAEGSGLASSIPTPVGTPTSTPILNSMETPSADATNSGEVLARFPAGLQNSSNGKCATNALATVQEIIGIAPKFDIASCFSNKMDSTRNSGHGKVECLYEVYQADVKYTTHSHRSVEEPSLIVYPAKRKTYCCCPDDMLEEIAKKITVNQEKPKPSKQVVQPDRSSNDRGYENSSVVDQRPQTDPSIQERPKPKPPNQVVQSDRSSDGRGYENSSVVYQRPQTDPSVQDRPICCVHRPCNYSQTSSECSTNTTATTSSDLPPLKKKKKTVKEKKPKKEMVKEKKPKSRKKIKTNDRPTCCNKRKCRKSCSESSGTRSLSTSTSDNSWKSKEKKQKVKKVKEKKPKEKKIKEKKTPKVKVKKSKCTCLRELQRLSDKCCTAGSTIRPFNEKVNEPIKRKKEPRKRFKVKPPSRNEKLQTTGGNIACCECKKPISQPQVIPVSSVEKKSIVTEPKMVVEKVLKKPTPVNQTTFEAQPQCQQLILNRNINIYLQIEKFCKQKPILLSRKQYDKVKKTIEGKRGNLKLKKGSRPSNQCCSCSVGDIREKNNELGLNNPKNIHTNVCTLSRTEEASQDSSLVFTTKNNIPQSTEQTSQKNTSPLMKIKRALNSAEQISEKNSRTSMVKKRAHKKTEHTNQNNSLTFFTKKRTHNKTEQASQYSSLLMSQNEKNKAQIRSTGVSPKQSLIQQIYQDTGVTTDPKIKEKTIKERSKKTQYKENILEPVKHAHNVINYIKKGSKSNDASRLKCAQCDNNKDFHVSISSKCKQKGCKGDQRYYKGTDNLCNICRMVQDLEGDIIYPIEKQKSGTRRAASSAEVHYANINTAKRVTFSSSNLDDDFLRQASNIYLLKKPSSYTLHTLFKGYGHPKCPTPNLGTSMDSLSSDNMSWKSNKAEPLEELRNRRPFLKRLMSCLVMRSKASELRFGQPLPKVTSVNSSIDSYHINTSLGGIELTSSIYDTSASYFTNHSILPTNNAKIKRGGFLSSVKGFLSYNRKT